MPGGKEVLLLFTAFLFLWGLVYSAPTIVAVADALIPLVLVVGLVIAVLRLVCHYTNRDR